MTEMFARSPMMLRTAETEGRISALEKMVERIAKKIGLEDDREDIPLRGVQLSDGSDADERPVGPTTPELHSVRPEPDEPRVQAPRDRRKHRS
jgi:hypothetical protein